MGRHVRKPLNTSVKSETRIKKNKNFSERNIDDPQILSNRIAAIKNNPANPVYSLLLTKAMIDNKKISNETNNRIFAFIFLLTKKFGSWCCLTISQVNKHAKGTVIKNRISSMGKLKILNPRVN